MTERQRQKDRVRERGPLTLTGRDTDRQLLFDIFTEKTSRERARERKREREKM